LEECRQGKPGHGYGKLAVEETMLRVLLLLPFIGLLWIPFYNRVDPTILGFPFFYWYLFAWVPVTSLLIWLVDRGTPEES
jgi:hypothetical protein